MTFYHPDLVYEVLIMFLSGCKILLSNFYLKKAFTFIQNRKEVIEITFR